MFLIFFHLVWFQSTNSLCIYDPIDFNHWSFLDNPQMVPVMMRAKVDKLMELKNENNQYKKYHVCTDFFTIFVPCMQNKGFFELISNLL